MHLPSHVREKWTEETSWLIESGIEPEFSRLTKFVERRAVVANTPFGKLVGTKPDGEKDPKPVRRTGRLSPHKLPMVIRDKKSEPRRTQNAATQVSTNPEFQCPPVSLFCDGSHALESGVCAEQETLYELFEGEPCG